MAEEEAEKEAREDVTIWMFDPGTGEGRWV